MSVNCDHTFGRFSIAMIGIRWQCVKCDKIAPACFQPKPEAIYLEGSNGQSN